MNDSSMRCIHGCDTAVPRELHSERSCVQHFLLNIETNCAMMRRESATERATIERRREIETYVKSSALKLSEVATGSSRLSDNVKKRVLTTMLTLMNLQESVDRSNTRFVQLRPPQRSEEQTPHPASMLG